MIQNNEIWLIHNPDNLRALYDLYSKFNGVLDQYQKFYKERATYIKSDGYSTVSINGAMVNKLDIIGSIYNIPTYETIAQDIIEATNDSNDILVLDIDSVGGMVNGISTVINAINEAKKTKKVYAYVSGVAFSAGYWIASQADQIFVHDTSQVGSIGAMITSYQYDLSDLKITKHTFRSQVSPNKNPDAGSQDFVDDMQEIVDTAGMLFVNGVASGRNVTADKVLSDFGQGKVFFAQDAVNRGMADSIGSISTLIERVIMTKKQDEAVTQATVDIEVVAKEAIAKERKRIQVIQEHKLASCQKDLVNHFIDTGIDAEDAKAILDKIVVTSTVTSKEPDTVVSKLNALMENQENNPEIKKIEGKLEAKSEDSKGVVSSQDAEAIVNKLFKRKA